MKKYLSGVLAVLLAAGTLSACGTAPQPDTGDTGSPSAPGASAVSESSEAADAGEAGYQKFDDITLRQLQCWNGGFKTAKDQYNNDVAAAIREKIGVTVEFEGIMMSETEKLNLMFASGDMPDIINAPYWGGNTGETQVIKKAAVEGRLSDIKDELPKYPNLAKIYELGVVSQAYLDNDLDAPEFNGARYVLPWGIPGDTADITNWTYGVFVRGDVPKALGIDETQIKTTDQLIDFMTKARDYGFKDVNGNGCMMATTFHEGWDSTGYQMNFDAKKLTRYELDADGNITYDILTENWVNKHLAMWKMVHEGLMDKECFKHSDEQANEKVGNGTALFASAQYAGAVINATKLTGLYTSNPEMRYIPVGPLNYRDGQSLVQTSTEGTTGSAVLLFPTTCKSLDAALTYMDYCNSKEGMQLIQYGIEGKTCVINEQGMPRLRQDILERKAKGDASVEDDLRDAGVYLSGAVTGANQRMTWWGEQNAGEADAELPEVTAYKQTRPVEVIPGYPLDKLADGYENYEVVKSFAFEGTGEKDYTQRAYFAASEEEARQILVDYQNYLLAQENGMFKDFLAYMTEQYKSNEGVIL